MSPLQLCCFRWKGTIHGIEGSTLPVPWACIGTRTSSAGCVGRCVCHILGHSSDLNLHPLMARPKGPEPVPRSSPPAPRPLLRCKTRDAAASQPPTPRQIDSLPLQLQMGPCCVCGSAMQRRDARREEKG
jgi:hypothetical protein